MSENMNNNPLLGFARRPMMSVKLPSSNGNWYNDDMISYNSAGEIDVYQMLPKDELLLMNPDALLSGEANINLIKSCCPSINDPKSLLYPDANVLLLCIQKVTYGDTVTMQVTCPECLKKVEETKARIEEENKAKADDEKIDANNVIGEMERNKEVNPHPQENVFEIDDLIAQMQYLDKEYTLMTPEGLVLYLRPQTLGNKEQTGMILFQQEKIVQAFKDYSYEEAHSDEEKRKALSEVNVHYLKMSEINNDIITSCIDKITLPDGTYVDNKKFIHEYISNCSTKLIGEIMTEIQRINAIGLPAELEYQCDCCGHTWKDKFYGFNQSDFFGLGS